MQSSRQAVQLTSFPPSTPNSNLMGGPLCLGPFATIAILALARHVWIYLKHVQTPHVINPPVSLSAYLFPWLRLFGATTRLCLRLPFGRPSHYCPLNVSRPRC